MHDSRIPPYKPCLMLYDHVSLENDRQRNACAYVDRHVYNKAALYCITLYYRPRSEGDNVFGSVRPSVCLFVYQSKVFVCVSVISGRVRIIARMQSIGFFSEALYFRTNS